MKWIIAAFVLMVVSVVIQKWSSAKSEITKGVL